MARILVVDDEADIRLLHRIVLQGAGHDVTEASDGAAALDLVHQNPPDVVVTDYMMPIMTGGEFIAALRAEPATAEIGVVLVSASPREPGNGGADVVFRKPTSFPDLLAAVDKFAPTSQTAS